MKINRRIVLGTAAGLGAALALAACSSSTSPDSGSSAAAGGESTGTEPTSKICVLSADATTAEAIAFQEYYTNYIASNFPVEMVYSQGDLADAQAEKDAMESFIAAKCDGIISLASADREQQLQMATDAGIYYAVATGTVTDEQFETYGANEFFVGTIGPSNMTEYQAGYDEAKYFIERGDTSFGMFGGAVPYYSEMHIYRAAGILAALCEEGSTTYGGATDMGAILGKIFQDGTIKLEDFQSDVYDFVGYLDGYTIDATFQANQQAIVAKNPDAILAVGSGLGLWGAAVAGTEVQIFDIDAYTPDNLSAMEAGVLAFEAGKFTSINGPIFAATLSAIQGEPYRDADGNAIRLDQGYWIATSVDAFQQNVDADSAEAPLYDKDALAPYVAGGKTYDEFAEFVSKNTFADLVG